MTLERNIEYFICRMWVLFKRKKERGKRQLKSSIKQIEKELLNLSINSHFDYKESDQLKQFFLMEGDQRFKSFQNGFYKKIDKFIIDFNSFLGKGNFGQVYKCIDPTTQQEYACKVIKRLGNDENEMKKLEQEAKMMIASRGDYVAKLLFFNYSKDNAYFVIQLCNQGTLTDYINVNKSQLTENDYLSIFYKIVLGYYESIYKNGIIHRDLKLDNILIHDGIPKISDFGQSKKQLNSISATVNTAGSPIFTPPQGLSIQIPNSNQLQERYEYSQKFDIYSLGVILYMCFFGYSPGNPTTYLDIGNFMLRLYYEGTSIIDFPDTFPISEESKNGIRRMLEYKEEDRISIEDLLEHEMFSKIRFCKKENNANDDIDIRSTLNKSLINIAGADLVATRLASKIELQSSLQEVDKYFLFFRNHGAFYLVTLSNLFDCYQSFLQFTGILLPQLDSLFLCLSKLQLMNLKHPNKYLNMLQKKNTKIGDIPFNELYFKSSMYSSTAAKILVETREATAQFSDLIKKIELRMARLNENPQMTDAIEEAKKIILFISETKSPQPFVSDIQKQILGICKKHIFPQVKKLISNEISQELAESEIMFKVVLALLIIVGDKIKLQQYKTFNFQQFYQQFNQPNIKIIERIKGLMEELKDQIFA